MVITLYNSRSASSTGRASRGSFRQFVDSVGNHRINVRSEVSVKQYFIARTQHRSYHLVKTGVCS